MTVKEAWEIKNEYSALASGRFNQLAFVGLAFLWILVENEKTPSLSYLALPAILIVLSLVCDFAQYLFATRVWMAFAQEKQDELGHDSEISFGIPTRIPKSINRFFAVKMSSIVLGYLLLLGFAATLLLGG